RLDPAADRHCLPGGRAALRPRTGRARAAAPRRTAHRRRRARRCRHPAAERLWLVRAAAARHLRAQRGGPLRSRPIRRGHCRLGRLMASGAKDERRRRLIHEYFGGHARVRVLRESPAFGAPVFVVDFDRGPRHYRTLGSFGPNFGAFAGDEPQVTEQSSMDLMYPAHLVFHYERLMSLAFALCERPVTALLLGVGGAAM